ncbi:helix-turn-helix transcriptional regulator [Adlercreutzia shanghongiae]|uniref:LuxR C-terminal-related transcriptional regulator n=1 Tax=Adlercreutzia shanghongiae TaxID=3111773 RepID=A0ABU6IXY1_9ACTN|nr:LuxR C-terminal-related transcriptional regulator [Adlercreutzia sp. R22]MEC4294707.1 LuxR C-terminal-related transcriptional regulator [Adlercreutzia sp. R22]
MEGTPKHDRVAGLLRRAWGSPLLLSLLGLAATRVWLQCNMFGSYAQSDDGIVSVVSSFFYGGAMIAAALLAWRRPPSARAERAMGLWSFFVMTLATLVIIVGKENGSHATVMMAAVLAGIGGAIGGGMWTVVYRRLPLNQSVFYGFASLGLGSVGGLILSFLPNLASYVASAFMPALAFLGFQQAFKIPREKPAPVPVYDNEPRASVLRFLAGVAAFSFALGIARGFPVGEAVPFDAGMRIVHQLGVVALSTFIVWWAIVARRRMSFKFLWCLEVAVMALGILLLSLFPGSLTGAGVAIVNVADTLMLGVLWVTLQDVARHSSTHPYVIYGAAWAARVLFRNAGRILIALVGSSVTAVTSLAAVLVCAVVVSMVLLLSSDALKARPLFGARGFYEGGSAPREELPAEVSLAVEDVRGATARAVTVGAFADGGGQTPTPDDISLQERFGLSDREMEVLAPLSQGRSKAYIADMLFISENTVRAHVKRIYAKLDVHNKQELLDCLDRHRF